MTRRQWIINWKWWGRKQLCLIWGIILGSAWTDWRKPWKNLNKNSLRPDQGLNHAPSKYISDASRLELTCSVLLHHMPDGDTKLHILEYFTHSFRSLFYWEINIFTLKMGDHNLTEKFLINRKQKTAFEKTSLIMDEILVCALMKFHEHSSVFCYCPENSTDTKHSLSS
jgi:hypothetical protein